jgi:hypothetical protein
VGYWPSLASNMPRNGQDPQIDSSPPLWMALKKEGKIEFAGVPRTGYYRLLEPPETE